MELLVFRCTPLLLAVLLALACHSDTPLQPGEAPRDPPGPGTNRPPTAVLQVAWQGHEGIVSAGFNADGSSDPDGDSLYYTWDWGDGTTITGTNTRQWHDYIDNGTYTVVLTVTDSHGATGTANARVSIANWPPHISVATLKTRPIPATVPMPASVHVEYSDLGAADNPFLTVDWGDGTVSRDTVHVYREPGTYLVGVTVTDKDSAATSSQIPLTVWVYDPSQSHSIPGYDVIELGTLGGNNAVPAALNNLGEVVGSSGTADTVQHAFLWEDGKMQDLGPQHISDRGSWAGATTINDAGWILGSGVRTAPTGLAVWHRGVLTRFIALGGNGEDGGPGGVRISENGDLVLVNLPGHEYTKAALLRNGDLTAIGGLSQYGYSWATDMNTRGQVVGSSAYGRGPDSPWFLEHAFVWEDGTITELGDFGTPCRSDPARRCGYSAAYDINERGQIVGYATNAKSVRAVVWEPGDPQPRDLDFGEGKSGANAINERGQIAGNNWDAEEGFFRDGGAVMNLGSLGGGGTHVAAMNEDGVVVGTSITPGGVPHAFVWRRDTGIRDLGAGPFGAPHVQTTAIAINQRGDIIGYAAPCMLTDWGYCAGAEPARAILWRRVP